MTKTVADPTPQAKALHEAAAMGQALMGGTTHMRAAGTKYLPQFEAESDGAYKARLKSSWLFNGYKKTVRDMSGRVFSKSVEVTEGSLDDDIEANIDMEGRDLSSFARTVFEAALSGCGLTFVMAEAPRRDGDLTLLDAQAMNMRPYLVHVRVDDVLGWRSEAVGASSVLTHWRMLEVITERDPVNEFQDVVIRQVRVMDLVNGRVNVRLYREGKGGTAWVLFDEFLTDQSEITVIPFYAARVGFFDSEPPLQDLADINVAHWQSQSDQRNILHFARVPFLMAAGYDDDGGNRPLTVSAGMATTSIDPQFSVKWVEHTGASIEAGRQDLKDLEFQMQTFGLQLLVARQETATGATLDAAKETSQLAMMADSLKDCLEEALRMLSLYSGAEQSYSVQVNKDFGATMLDAQEVTAMLSAVNTGNMSRETFLRELARRGFIAEDTDIEAEIGAINMDQDALMTDAVSE